MRHAIYLLAAAVLLGMPGRAQGQNGIESTVEPAVIPGLVFTPSMAVGVSHDDNPVLASHGNPSPDDFISVVRPGGDLTFTQKHTKLGIAYRGTLVRYRELTEFDNYDQRGLIDFKHQPSKRVQLFLRNSFTDTPTTDAIQVAGVPFFRTGTLHDEFGGGASVFATKTLELRSEYRFDWIQFDRPVGIAEALLQGGHSHGITVDARQRVSPHWRVGASWEFRHSRLTGSADTFDVQNTEATVEWQPSPTVMVDGGAGFSYLALPAPLGSQFGPAGHISIHKKTQYAYLNLSASRSFVPAFAFGGSLQNQSVAGSARVPFAGHRGYIVGGLSWRSSQPVLAGDVGLRAWWTDVTVGYAVQRWLSVEAYYAGAYQDTTVVGGRVDRNRVGVQFVTSRPLRID